MSTAKHTGSELNAAAKDKSSRRALLKSGALAGVAAVGGLLSSQGVEGAEDEFYRAKKGRINQSVVSWCFNPMKVETLLRAPQARC